MFQNYFKIAWRSLVKNRASSFINIGGLAVGMSVAMLIGLWIYDELSFNKQFQNYDRIAQVMKNSTYEGALNTDGSEPIPLGIELRSSYENDFNYVVMSLGNTPHIIGFAEKEFTQSGNFMGPDAPEMLTLKMLYGNRGGLKDPNSIILSESLSKKIFGAADPMYKIISIDNKLVVKVTGVYEDFPNNSDFKEVSFIAPFDLWLSSIQNGKILQDDWNSEFIGIYVQINPNADFEKVSASIENVIANHISRGKAGQKTTLFLHPMSKWHLYSKFENGVNATSDELKFVWFYAIIGVFVLLLACINFMNLSSARSAKRAKEVGIRKVIGPIRRQLIGQFLSESLLVATAAFLIAIILVQLTLPWFNAVTDRTIPFPLTNPIFWLMSTTFIILTGLLAGSYPAFYLSSFKPVKVLSGTFKAGRFAAIPRKILVVFQFTVSIALIIGTIIVYRQIQFAKNRPIGYSLEGLLQIQMESPDLQGKSDVLRNELENTGVVTQIGRSQSPLTDIWNTKNGFDWNGTNRDTSAYFGTIRVSYEYGKTIGWQIVEGRDFSKEFADDSAGFVINQAAAKLMGLKKPIGHIVSAGGNQPIYFKILGVVKDMVIRSPYKLAFPTIYYLGKGEWLFVKLKPNVSADYALPKIKAAFKKLFPASLFSYKFADENYEAKFTAEEHISKLASFFCVPAILISFLGLFGLASFVAEQRTKKIGVRKVLGATVLNIWKMMSKDFVMLVIVSSIIAMPAAYLFMHNWLQNYQYRTEISWWIFGSSGIGALLITLLTVSYQAVKAALANPVKTLRTE